MHAAPLVSIANPSATLRHILSMAVAWAAAVCLTWRAQLLSISLMQAFTLLLASSVVITMLGMTAHALRSQPVVLRALECDWRQPIARVIACKLVLASVTALELLFALSLAQILRRVLD